MLLSKWPNKSCIFKLLVSIIHHFLLSSQYLISILLPSFHINFARKTIRNSHQIIGATSLNLLVISSDHLGILMRECKLKFWFKHYSTNFPWCINNANGWITEFLIGRSHGVFCLKHYMCNLNLNIWSSYNMCKDCRN